MQALKLAQDAQAHVRAEAAKQLPSGRGNLAPRLACAIGNTAASCAGWYAPFFKEAVQLKQRVNIAHQDYVSSEVNGALSTSGLGWAVYIISAAL
jgi:hypothetical protein